MFIEYRHSGDSADKRLYVTAATISWYMPEITMSDYESTLIFSAMVQSCVLSHVMKIV